MKRKSKKSEKRDPLSYQKRTYRQMMLAQGLTSSFVTIRETDLIILAQKDVTVRATECVLQYRSQLENYIAGNPAFLSSLIPLEQDPLAPPIVKAMIKAALVADVGPMAAVAGAVAEFVGRDLLESETDEIVIENGGDVFMHRKHDSIAAIFAGTSPLSNKIGIKVPAQCMPLGICTSSGTIGHSLSFGLADSVTVIARSVCLADAAATRLGNEMKDKADMNKTLAIARQLEGLQGVTIVKDDQLGVWGDFELVKLTT